MSWLLTNCLVVFTFALSKSPNAMQPIQCTAHVGDVIRKIVSWISTFKITSLANHIALRKRLGEAALRTAQRRFAISITALPMRNARMKSPARIRVSEVPGRVTKAMLVIMQTGNILSRFPSTLE
jgi:hypothetical protein